MKQTNSLIKDLVLIFGILFISKGTAQDYIPLLDSANEWQLTTCYFGCLTDYYFTDGDTLVDGKNYKILDGYHYIERNLLLREEVGEKKIYLNIVSESGNEEYLLYDFSLQEGDEMNLFNPITPFPEDAGIFQVDSIKLRELVDMNEYRHFYLSPIKTNTISSERAVWIEGVGSLSMINAPGGHPDINEVGALSCFFKNSDLFYSNLDSIDACEPNILSVIVNTLAHINATMYFKNKISVIQDASAIYKFEVYNLEGKLLKTQYNTFKEDEVRIDFSNLKEGIYFIVTSGFNKQRKTFRVVN